MQTTPSKEEIMKLFHVMKNITASKTDEERKNFINDIRGNNGEKQKKQATLNILANMNTTQIMTKEQSTLIFQFLKEHLSEISRDLHNFPYKIDVLYYPEINVHLGWDGFHDYYDDENYKCVVKVTKHYQTDFNLIFHFKNDEKIKEAEISLSFDKDKLQHINFIKPPNKALNILFNSEAIMDGL